MNPLWAMLERAAGPEYARTRARAERLHGALSARGMRAGERFAVLSWNTSDYLELYFAAARGGFVLCPLNVRLARPEIEAILEDSGARFVLEGVAGLDALCREVPPVAKVDPEAPAQLYYTSGTTGKPKGVVLTQRNVEVHARAAIAELGLSERDTWAHIAPMFHLADAWAIFAITHCGGRHVYLPRFEPELALELLVRERVTITNLIPTMLNLMVRHPSARGRDYSGLRAILSGGAPIAPQLVREILELFGCEYVQTYGMTETSPYLTLGLLKPHLAALPLEERVRWLAKTGRPFQGVELRVVDEQGNDVPADGQSVGEIRVRGETVTPGYWNQPEVTAAAFDGRWLKTGDLATLAHEGYVEIVDRKKDMILTGGENVYSTEVEHALFAHPAVLEVAVYGMPDELWGERVCAAVVLRPGKSASAQELQDFCRLRIAAYKVPRAIEFLGELPRTGSGKIQKHALRVRARR
ncbi:MAG: AMP-binding protein [Planctomycetes bacterium]|nr:AMP-binding protein [Planctomycetota bacterium]